MITERQLVTVQKVTGIERIPEKDKIFLATVQGWKVIVDNTVIVGDLILYVQPDVMLPVMPEFEFLRHRTYSIKYNGFRIKTMKMAGVISEGLVVPLSVVKGKVNSKKLVEGFNVTEIIGAVRYDVEELNEHKRKVNKSWIFKKLMRYKWFRQLRQLYIKGSYAKHTYPLSISKSGESNIQTAFARLSRKAYLRYGVTEKLEGQAVTYELHKGKFRVYSHNVHLTKQDTSNWWKYAIENDVEEKMKKLGKNLKLTSFAIQGELIGPGIQKNIYDLAERDLYIYNIRDTATRKDIDIIELSDEGFKAVPAVSVAMSLPNSVDEILKHAEGNSVLNKNVKREGLVWRAVTGDGSKLSFKAKSKAYLLWWDKKVLKDSKKEK